MAQVPARFAYEFCRVTNGQLSQAMELRASDVDSSTLLLAHGLLADLEVMLQHSIVGRLRGDAPGLYCCQTYR